MARLINADKLKPLFSPVLTGKTTYTADEIMFSIVSSPTVEAIPVDFIWDRAEFYEKQWLEDDNHWAKNVAEALRALLEDWDGEVGDILGKYE